MRKPGRRIIIARTRLAKRPRLGALAIWGLGAIALLDVAVRAGLAWK